MYKLTDESAALLEFPVRDGPVGELTVSERRVLRYLPTNLSRSDIARELFVSVNTVNTHIRNIYSKLGANNRKDAVECARAMKNRRPLMENSGVVEQELMLYSIRIHGHLEATTLDAFPNMVSQQRGDDCVLTGVLADHSALFGILAQIEILGLELVEIRRLVPKLEPP